MDGPPLRRLILEKKKSLLQRDSPNYHGSLTVFYLEVRFWGGGGGGGGG